MSPDFILPLIPTPCCNCLKCKSPSSLAGYKNAGTWEECVRQCLYLGVLSILWDSIRKTHSRKCLLRFCSIRLKCTLSVGNPFFSLVLSHLLHVVYMLSLFLKVLLIYFFERKRAPESGTKGERQAHTTLSSEPGARLDPMTLRS